MRAVEGIAAWAPGPPLGTDRETHRHAGVLPPCQSSGSSLLLPRAPRASLLQPGWGQRRRRQGNWWRRGWGQWRPRWRCRYYQPVGGREERVRKTSFCVYFFWLYLLEFLPNADVGVLLFYLKFKGIYFWGLVDAWKMSRTRLKHLKNWLMHSGYFCGIANTRTRG